MLLDEDIVLAVSVSFILTCTLNTFLTLPFITLHFDIM